MFQVAQNQAQVKPSDWITADAVPDPTPLPKVVGWSILARPVSILAKTKGGIIVPQTLQDDVAKVTTVARVLAMGDLAYEHPDFKGRAWCKVGDYVAYGKFSGMKLLYKGVALIMLEDRNVTLVLDDPRSIDPNFNLAR